MPSYLSPGVYVQELDASTRPPELKAARTAGLRSRSTWESEHTTTAFIGWASRGPTDLPTRIESWPEFEEVFGHPLDGMFLSHSVRGFFENGGRDARIVRLPDAPGSDWMGEMLGNSRSRSGLSAFEQVDDVSLLVLPDLMGRVTDGGAQSEKVNAVHLAAIAHCEFMGDRIALLDAPPGLDPQQIRDWRTHTGYDTKFGALFWPWVHPTTVAGRSDILVPPSGHIAGLIADVDRSFGPDRAAVQRSISGISAPAWRALRIEEELLHPIGINALIVAPDGNVILNGARSMSQDPAWRHLATRRLMSFVGRNLIRNTRWAIAEKPGDRSVWEQLEHDVEGLLLLLWQAGALSAEDAANAFDVRCDETTNDFGDLEQFGVIRMDAWVRVTDEVHPFRVIWAGL